MHLSRFLCIATACAGLSAAREPCTYEKKVAGIQHEIDTISSHTYADAKKIPLAPGASRTFFVTPNEDPNLVLEINTGVTAKSVRAELVSLATFLNAKVPAHTLHYTRNANGTVTTDFVQLDRYTLRRAHAREIHEFNKDCQITKITGFVHSSLVCLENINSKKHPVIDRLCKKFEEAKRRGQAGIAIK